MSATPNQAPSADQLADRDAQAAIATRFADLSLLRFSVVHLLDADPADQPSPAIEENLEELRSTHDVAITPMPRSAADREIAEGSQLPGNRPIIPGRQLFAIMARPRQLATASKQQPA